VILYSLSIINKLLAVLAGSTNHFFRKIPKEVGKEEVCSNGGILHDSTSVKYYYIFIIKPGEVNVNR